MVWGLNLNHQFSLCLSVCTTSENRPTMKSFFSPIITEAYSTSWACKAGPYLSKTHAVQHCHAVLTFKQDTCILKIAQAIKIVQAFKILLHCLGRKQDTQNCSSMLSIQLDHWSCRSQIFLQVGQCWLKSWPCLEHAWRPTILELSKDNSKAVCSAIACWLFSSMNW